ncbi:MAG: hypothetical protein H0Z35_01980 [Thermoanaerobacteraceae bacterium]|nr:hypothetical protein [Thermoanaerobacteraceae bacterium]
MTEEKFYHLVCEAIEACTGIEALMVDDRTMFLDFGLLPGEMMTVIYRLQSLTGIFLPPTILKSVLREDMEFGELYQIFSAAAEENGLMRH